MKLMLSQPNLAEVGVDAELGDKGLFKYHAIGQGGRGGYPKCSLSLTRGGGGVQQMITRS